MDRPPRPAWLPQVDLRSVTRDSNIACTTISVILNGETYEWIKLGTLSRMELEGKRVQWIGAYFDHGITDTSEKSAYALHFDVVGLQLTDFSHGAATFRAWLSGSALDSESLKVPSAPYDLSKFEWCPACKGKERHQMTAFTPPPNLELWKKLRGVELRIYCFPVRPDTEDEDE